MLIFVTFAVTLLALTVKTIWVDDNADFFMPI